MEKGNLVIKGTIDLNQFWPENVKNNLQSDSDADTMKVKVDKASAVFTSAAGNKKSTDLLSIAGFFHNQDEEQIFKSVLNKKDELSIRMQGIDAPELHYQTGDPLYRQHMGETATIALYQYLKKMTTTNILNCEIFTQVDAPNDTFDMYGRCVADILIKDKKGKTINVNHWLLENGWAFPGFYNSMTVTEIKELTALANTAMTKKKNIWKYYSDTIKPLDRTLIHAKKNIDYDAKADKKSPVIFPKLFRRLYTYEIKGGATFSTAGYQAFLKENPDSCCKTADFITTGYPSKTMHLHDFISPTGKINFKPTELVIKEGGTTLKDSTGAKITAF